MKYYFIYSAGGGAGDWNGVKRVWLSSMKESLKCNILLKFGDIFFNHATGNDIYRPERWAEITNLRNWLFDATHDNYVLNESNILLDSGTAKAVSWIHHNNEDLNCDQLIDRFNRIFYEKNIFEKYISIIIDSEITNAVTFDIPNPFKIRSQCNDTRLNILEQDSADKLIKLSAEYSNILYSELSSRIGSVQALNKLMTIINGTWNINQINIFFNKLDYTPLNLAIGGLSAENNVEKFNNYLSTLDNIDLEHFSHVHFLGCGGIKKVNELKIAGYTSSNYSVDCSTPINRTIDGNLNGTNQSCYYVYGTMEQIRIMPSTRNDILNKHNHAFEPYYSLEEMSDILDLVLEHQNNNSSSFTYDARAKLLFHNIDTFRRHAE